MKKQMSKGAYYFLVVVLCFAVMGVFAYGWMWDTGTTYEDVEDYATTRYNHPEQFTTPYNVDVNLTRMLDNNTVPPTDTWQFMVFYTVGSGITDWEVLGTNWSTVIGNDSATDGVDKFSMDINQTDISTTYQYTYTMTLYDDNYTTSWTKALTQKVYCNEVVFIVGSKDYSAVDYHLKVAYGDSS